MNTTLSTVAPIFRKKAFNLPAFLANCADVVQVLLGHVHIILLSDHPAKNRSNLHTTVAIWNSLYSGMYLGFDLVENLLVSLPHLYATNKLLAAFLSAGYGLCFSYRFRICMFNAMKLVRWNRSLFHYAHADLSGRERFASNVGGFLNGV